MMNMTVKVRASHYLAIPEQSEPVSWEIFFRNLSFHQYISNLYQITRPDMVNNPSKKPLESIAEKWQVVSFQTNLKLFSLQFDKNPEIA